MRSARQWGRGCVPSAPTLCDWFPLLPCGEDLPFTSCFQNDALHSYCGLGSRPEREESHVAEHCSSALDTSLGCSCRAFVCLISSQLQCLPFTGAGFLVQQAHFLMVGIVQPLSACHASRTARPGRDRSVGTDVWHLPVPLSHKE